MVWLIFALAFFLAGGIIAGIQRAWAVVLVAVGGILLILPRLL
jgi:hypothetical protein